MLVVLYGVILLLCCWWHPNFGSTMGDVYEFKEFDI